jgi:hypothetical protein
MRAASGWTCSKFAASVLANRSVIAIENLEQKLIQGTLTPALSQREREVRRKCDVDRDAEFLLHTIKVIFMVGGSLLIIVGLLAWTVQRILRPVDLAARERNLPFRFSMGDFLCLFWLIQLPLTFVFRLKDSAPQDAHELRSFYWILMAVVWGVAPLAWVTVARALSKAGVGGGIHRFVFLGLVLPTVYYGLFPLISISMALLLRGAEYMAVNKSYVVLWGFLLVGIVASGFYSPWMMQHVAVGAEGGLGEGENG